MWFARSSNQSIFLYEWAKPYFSCRCSNHYNCDANFTVIISYFLLKEPLTTQRILGVSIGGLGAVLLIYLGNSGLGTGSLLGNIFICINALAFAFYLVIVKPLMSKYKPITVIGWTFMFGFIFMFPFCIEN